METVFRENEQQGHPRIAGAIEPAEDSSEVLTALQRISVRIPSRFTVLRMRKESGREEARGGIRSVCECLTTGLFSTNLRCRDTFVKQKDQLLCIRLILNRLDEEKSTKQDGNPFEDRKFPDTFFEFSLSLTEQERSTGWRVDKRGDKTAELRHDGS